jgi:hypothetical protein
MRATGQLDKEVDACSGVDWIGFYLIVIVICMHFVSLTPAGPLKSGS